MYKSSAAPAKISFGEAISVPSLIFPELSVSINSIREAPLNSFTAFGPFSPGWSPMEDI